MCIVKDVKNDTLQDNDSAIWAIVKNQKFKT